MVTGVRISRKAGKKGRVSAISACRLQLHERLTDVAVTVGRRFGGPLRRRGEPVRLGIPFPKGVCRDERTIGLDGPWGPMAAQARSLDRWSDGSARWVLLEFDAFLDGGVDAAYTVRTDSHQAMPAMPLAVVSAEDSIEINTGAAQFVFRRNGAFPFEAVALDGAPALDVARSGLLAELADGTRLESHVRRLRVQEQGPLRAVVHVEGTMGTWRGPGLDFELRAHFFAASATVRAELTVRNPRRARHPGGIWELGDAGSVEIRDLSLVFAMPADRRAVRLRCSPEIEAPFEDCDFPFAISQHSSGGDNWRSPVHRNRQGVVPHEQRGYRLRAGATERIGRRATPVVALSGRRCSLALAVPAFWQNFPKSIESDGTALVLRLFPGTCTDVHELQGGEQKTHEFYLAFGHDTVTDVPLDWCRAPLLATADPHACCQSGAVPYLVPAGEDPDGGYLSLVAEGLGPHGFLNRREVIDEYGWRNFGDVYADHESAFQPVDAPLISHYNNQYDLIYGFGCQYLRTGDGRFHQLMTELASHVADIDIYHTDRDKAAYNHGLFWHTFHYVDAGTSTHRSYPRADRVWGGGPSAEHNYTSGFALHYFLTGDARSRRAVLDLADWVVAMDDGRRSRFRWLDRGATGLASATGSADYHGPGRGAAHSILALLEAARLSGDPHYLAKAEELIRRCVHPDDDIASRHLDDVENRWSYSAFLQALGKYLDFKAERGELDDCYAYARASLLHYARWMAAHEYLYLEKPERLEYPTETWAAQEIRKACVFQHATMHASDDERVQFRERAEYFYRGAINELQRRSTRACTRALALLMAYGFSQAYFRLNPRVAAPAPLGAPCDFGAPASFIPQKQRAMRVAVMVGGAAGAALLTLALRVLG
jgi:hypothetical protein